MLQKTVVTLLVLACVPAIAGYVQERHAAVQLMQKKQFEKALQALREAAAAEDVSDFQKSDALALAAQCARQRKKYDLAAELAEDIPGEAMSKMGHMQNLVAQGKYRELVENWGDENLDAWPEYPAHRAYIARGEAYSRLGKGEKAEEDLRKAAALPADKREFAETWLNIARNRQANLEHDILALKAYNRVIERDDIGGYWARFQCVLSAAAILRGRGEYEQALKTLGRANPREHTGWWKGRMLMALAKTLAAAGRREEAVAAYEEILRDDALRERFHDAARKAAEGLGGPDE